MLNEFTNVFCNWAMEKLSTYNNLVVAPKWTHQHINRRLSAKLGKKRLEKVALKTPHEILVSRSADHCSQSSHTGGIANLAEILESSSIELPLESVEWQLICNPTSSVSKLIRSVAPLYLRWIPLDPLDSNLVPVTVSRLFHLTDSSTPYPLTQYFRSAGIDLVERSVPSAQKVEHVSLNRTGLSGLCCDMRPSAVLFNKFQDKIAMEAAFIAAGLHFYSNTHSITDLKSIEALRYFLLWQSTKSHVYGSAMLRSLTGVHLSFNSDDELLRRSIFASPPSESTSAENDALFSISRWALCLAEDTEIQAYEFVNWMQAMCTEGYEADYLTSLVSLDTGELASRLGLENTKNKNNAVFLSHLSLRVEDRFEKVVMVSRKENASPPQGHPPHKEIIMVTLSDD